jgi:2-hydroxyglutarate dehydrogenase
LPRDQRIPIYFAKGPYVSYCGQNLKGISRLIYLCPEVGRQGAPSFTSLGTHLTLDLQGKIKFGPDIEWIPPPDPTPDGEVEEYWREHLVPDDSPAKMREMHKAIAAYLLGVDFDGLSADYVGIRPKLIPHGAGFQDFVLRKDYPATLLGGNADSQRSPMITLLGIESPGLTPSLAIA